MIPVPLVRKVTLHLPLELTKKRVAFNVKLDPPDHPALMDPLVLQALTETQESPVMLPIRVLQDQRGRLVTQDPRVRLDLLEEMATLVKRVNVAQENRDQRENRDRKVHPVKKDQLEVWDLPLT